MKRNNLLLLLLSFSLLSYGQELPTEKSENHIQVEGTTIFMVPPPDFEVSNNFKGFQDPNEPTAMIMVVEIPGPYTEVSKGFNSETLKSRGMELKSKKEIKVSEFDGLLLELDQAANGMVFSKQILIYGNQESTTLINGVYLKDSLTLGEKIKESVLSTILDSEIENNPREVLDYTINEDAGSLKFVSVIGNGMLLNRDLKIPTESADKAILITDKSFAKVIIEDKEAFCISRLSKLPGNYNLKETNAIEIDNLKGYEVFAQNKEEEMVQVILFNKDKSYYIFVGTYLKENKEALNDIKSIIKTFNRK